MEKEVRVYLAGKVHGPKWEVVKGFKDVRFEASDEKKHGEHGWGFSYYDFGAWNPEWIDLTEQFLGPLLRCEILLAYLETPDSFGSIAEIAYAAAIGKPCHVIISGCAKPDGIDDGTWHDELYDAYWFVTALPGVRAYAVPDRKEARRVAGSIVGKVSYSEYLNSDAWRTTRQKALSRAGHKCQLCGSVTNLRVHHNTYANLGHENAEDLIVLCDLCHGKHHGIVATPPKEE